MSKKILIVDDDTSIIDSLKYLLEDEGYSVTTSSNGNFIKTKFNGTKPDLILLDYLLPGENGGTITKKLKKAKDTKNIPVIIISASYNIKDIVVDAGADDFIPKPYDIKDILNKLEQHLLN